MIEIFLMALWGLTITTLDVAEDEFFDASESLEDNDEIPKEELDSTRAEGRLKPFDTLRLLHFPDSIMYEPVTQVSLLDLFDCPFSS